MNPKGGHLVRCTVNGGAHLTFKLILGVTHWLEQEQLIVRRSLLGNNDLKKSQKKKTFLETTLVSTVLINGAEVEKICTHLLFSVDDKVTSGIIGVLMMVRKLGFSHSI